jgi:hypothetical protein
MSFRVQDPSEAVSPMTKMLIDSLLAGNQQRVNAPPAPKLKRSEIRLQLADVATTVDRASRKKGGEPPSLTKSILNLLNGPSGSNSIERLAFETDPSQNNTYAAVYHSKIKLIPDSVLKRIAIQDDLVAAIVNTRSAQIQSFGRPQPDRFSTGFKIIPDEGVLDKMTQEEREKTERRIDEAQKLLVTCGHTKGWSDRDRLTLPQYLGMSARNAVTVGRLATEIVWVEDSVSGKKKFHSFRPIDAGTIYRAAPQKEAAQAVREEALRLLEQLKNEKFEPERFEADEYAWIQVIDGKPMQAFTEDECVVHNFYPVSDVELDGYPVTPIDTAIAAVTTHINITTHNRMYFQSGRAARGMLVIKSDDVGEETVSRIKHQFQASINNVQNSLADAGLRRRQPTTRSVAADRHRRPGHGVPVPERHERARDHVRVPDLAGGTARLPAPEPRHQQPGAVASPTTSTSWRRRATSASGRCGAV